ncbi:hypothetical protein [Caulobacter sp. FWC2]|uniref:hypothetical protein n=1 Tax=Caulobacter sp. FWC2 TaxID=69664 RepID=UPI000C147F03|nr:hypothetical protein [Caulobacter sp. FWC2]PIB94446.1 hypothetical protein CSW62_24445 [Caulobacter sp. FWC2]
MRFKVVALATGLLIAATVQVGVAQAQSFVRPDCQGVNGGVALRYDTSEHARWYQRFWTGTCDHLAFCIPGSPNWNEIVGKLLIKGGPSERAALLPKACRLGQLIGLEWSREKAIRKIDTHDLRLFSTTLEATGDTLKGLDKVEQAARIKLAPR